MRFSTKMPEAMFLRLKAALHSDKIQNRRPVFVPEHSLELFTLIPTDKKYFIIHSNGDIVNLTVICDGKSTYEGIKIQLSNAFKGS